MKNSYIIPACLCLLLSSCSLFKPKKSLPDSGNIQQVEIKAPETPVVEVQQPEFITPPTIADTTNPSELVESAATVSLSDFSPAELDHIGACSYNPFPDGRNKFSIDLNKEKENFRYPLDNGKFSSGYGYRGRSFHSGADILESPNAPIYAAFDGVVRFSKPYSGYGNVIVIRHKNGLETVYSHNARNLVRAGNVVKAGDKIALVGRTGRATTTHLHFEARVMGKTINPLLLIDPANSTLQSGVLTIERNGSTIKASNNKKSVNLATRPSAPSQEQAKVTQTKPSVSESKSDTKPTTTTSTSTSSSKSYHTIVKGDTLSALAKRYGTSVSKICSLNSINEKTILSLGRKLRIR